MKITFWVLYYVTTIWSLGALLQGVRRGGRKLGKDPKKLGRNIKEIRKNPKDFSEKSKKNPREIQNFRPEIQKIQNVQKVLNNFHAEPYHTKQMY